MQTKLFEIRDVATMISAMVTRLEGDNPKEKNILGWVGLGRPSDGGYESYMIELSRFSGSPDPQEWDSGARTCPVAHQYINDNWGSLVSGQVIDVEFILGLSEKPKESEFIDKDETP